MQVLLFLEFQKKNQKYRQPVYIGYDNFYNLNSATL